MGRRKEVNRGNRAPKDLEEIDSGLSDLQATENTQNHQRNLWKSLEIKAADLEKLGKKPCSACGLEVSAACRAPYTFVSINRPKCLTASS